MTSYMPMIKGVNEDKWTGNGLRFATAGEAINYCIDLQSRWMGCKPGVENRKASLTIDRVTHRFNGLTGKLSCADVSDAIIIEDNVRV